MFNFHKPRTYRSTEGCCICKAKSSSSRFTDSRKYERDTMLCFDLKYPRQGEICNACVLLVKRFKRLPAGSKRNWSHVVDAKAGIGPGCSKIQTKYKSERISSRAALTNPAPTSTSNGLVGDSASNSVNNISYMSEKFSKIMKKTKKIKDSTHSLKRKSANNGWSQSNTQSPTTPDSLDSDYEDTRAHGYLSGGQGSGAIVQFQTQTRASAYRAQAAAEARKKIKLGTKRRKCLPPRKYRRSISYEESVEFFDEGEWKERISCCGMLLECAALNGALLIDIANYKPCKQHCRSILNSKKEPTETTNVINIENKGFAMPSQKAIIQTIPAVVQLQPLQNPAPTLTPSSSSLTLTRNTNCSFKPAMTTPVLKKHHLFFKRQSECFPPGDMVAKHINNDINSTIATGTTSTAHISIIKTESEFNIPSLQQHHHKNQQQQISTSPQRYIENAINSRPSVNTTAILTNSSTTSNLTVSVTSLSSPSFLSTIPQMPKHSLAKVTTISPPLMSSTTSSNNNSNNGTLPLAKPSNFLHKVKTDTGKIIKNSLDKFNTAIRLKNSDIQEMKPIIKTVDKSYILAKPPTQANIITVNPTTTATATYQSLATYVTAQPPLTTTSLSAASPTSSTSSTSSNKFSDNSSDSGFDENMLDRKSTSPLQEDCENKLLSRSGVQTMFLASGVQIQGQPQNLVLTGNETKILQNRKYGSITTNSVTSIPRSNYHPSTTTVKIAQISTNPHVLSSTSSSAVSSSASMSSAAQAKMRAIYNNNNTIQHENGITTIVPASSLAASSQTAAMQNIAPSTVTITPAPPMGTQFNTQNVIPRKLTTANIINLQNNTNISNSHNNICGVNHHHFNSNTSNGLSATNQKIILLKTSPNSTTVTPPTNYNSLQTATLVGSQGGGGGVITR